MSRKYPDYGEWVARDPSGARLNQIERDWHVHCWIHEEQATMVGRALNGLPRQEILEVGCGTGRLAKLLPPAVLYHGVDGSAFLLDHARARNPDKAFTCCDIRDLVSGPVELVVAFGFMKHFCLAEWDAVFTRLLTLGRRCLIDIPIAVGRNEDTGTEFHHVFVRRRRVLRVADSVQRKCLTVTQGASGETYFLFEER